MREGEFELAQPTTAATVRERGNKSSKLDRDNEMGYSKMLLGLVLLITLAATSTAQPGTVAPGFTCTTTKATCHSLIDYVSPNTTTISTILSLFQIKRFRDLLGANGLSNSTSIPTRPSKRTRGSESPSLCLCENGTVALVNNISDPNKIDVGQKLWIPLPCSCDEVAGAKVVHYGHVVEAGSSVERIAMTYGTTEDILLKLNGMVNASQLLAGQVLDVPLKEPNPKNQLQRALQPAFLYKPFFSSFHFISPVFFSLLTSVLSAVLSLFSPFSPSILHSSPLSYVLHSSPLSFVDFLVVVGLTVGLGFGLGGLRFVRGFGFWSRRRSGLRFAVGGFAVLSLCRSGCAVGLGCGWVCRGSWVCRGCGCGCGGLRFGLGVVVEPWVWVWLWWLFWSRRGGGAVGVGVVVVVVLVSAWWWSRGSCTSSVNSSSLDYPLLVSNGTYVYTANSCVKCNCDSANNYTSWSTCPAVRCGGTNNLNLGDVATSTTCNKTFCAYAGYTKNTIFTTLSTESTCPAGAPAPSPSGAPSPGAPAPSPSGTPGSNASPGTPGSDASKIGSQGLRLNFLFISIQLIFLCFHLSQ
uniref:LysM domain-containing protein n=1 Tax=Fagus sylvatica TaxID=28930 RepID=A0A2N9FVY8_FAGSY